MRDFAQDTGLDRVVIAGAAALGGAAASMIPGVGEAMDAIVLADPSSSDLERSLAGASMGLDESLSGVSPNAAALIFAGRVLKRVECPKPGSTTVYRAVDEAGNTNYVGITDDFARRSEEQARKGLRIREMDGLKGIDRADARAVEQVLIERYGIFKNRSGQVVNEGGTLLNKMNSISPSNSIYKDAIDRGHMILRYTGN
jgi:hypothetical protein